VCNFCRKRTDDLRYCLGNIRRLFDQREGPPTIAALRIDGGNPTFGGRPFHFFSRVVAFGFENKVNQRIGLQTDDEIRRTAAMRKALDALSGGGSTNVYGTNHDTNAAPATTPHPQVIVSGREHG